MRPKPKPQPPGIGRVFPGADTYRQPPITVECVATLHQKEKYNILVASESKSSPDHWELFTMAGNGNLTAYLPGCRPDHVRSGVNVCDGKSHAFAMTYEQDRVRLFVDGREIANESIAKQEPKSNSRSPLAGPLAIGRLVSGRIGCVGEIAWVRISRARQSVIASSDTQPARDDETLGLWRLDGKDVDEKDIEEQGQTGTPANTQADPAKRNEQPYDENRVSSLIRDALDSGDAIRGARVFASAKLACMSCHRVGTHGGEVGPELASIAPQRDLRHLVESVLWPGREVKPEFVTWRVLTSSGAVVSGYKQSSENGILTLRDPATGKETRISESEIEDEVAGGTVMPAGLTAATSKRELLDLICFLNELRHVDGDLNGKVGAPIQRVIAESASQTHDHGPVDFPVTRQPISKTNWPNHDAPVNRDRVFDFYTKQAEYFRQHDQQPALIAPYLGLDGGQQGHWGNQDESTWADGRWNESALGSVQCGVLHGAGKTIARGICLKLGDQGKVSACFNPDTLTYDVIWKDGFVGFSSVRHGFMHGLQMQGKVIARDQAAKQDLPTRYHGFYRHGNRVVFAYRIGDVEYLDSPWEADGQFIHRVAPRDQHPMRGEFLARGFAQWPEVITTKIVPGKSQPYAIDTIELPFENPWNALMFCTGHDFLPDGSALVCTMQGDVWHVSGLDSDPQKPGHARWRRFASGLHYPLGLVVANGRIYVQCRDQLMRLTDLNDDGEADFYECVNKAFVTSAAGHDYICGLQRDTQGNFYTASGNQGLLRLSADGERAEVLATGFRNPDGLGILADGTITVPCSEGGWTPASMICAIPPDTDVTPHYGYGGPKNGEPPQLPLVYLPRGLDNSSGGQLLIQSDSFGPLDGKLAHFSFGTGCWFVVLIDEVNGQRQGAVVPMTGDFQSGVHRGRVSPCDGQLYVSGMTGWGSYTPDDGCFQRIRYTGDTVQIPVSFHVHENGVRVSFAEPIDLEVAGKASSHFAQAWNYRYSEAYGSPELSTTHPGVAGHDPLRIRSVQPLPDGRSLFLEIPELQPVNQLHLRLHVNQNDSITCSPAGSGHDLFITAHRLDAPFTQFDGYQSDPDKTIAVHPMLADLAPRSEASPNPWSQPIGNAREITIRTGKNLTYETPEFIVSANEPIALTLTNPDVVPHNWVLARRDQLEHVGALSNRLIADPNAYVRQYVPETDSVLVYTDIVAPGASQTVHFIAPAASGRYPFLCTFPGHWMVMNGIMVVR
ncbi:DUF6797 domain-containing protein [Stieleria varia]